MKKCPQCLLTKPLSEFRVRKDGSRSWCTECKRAYDRQHRLKNPSRRYGNMLKQRYGITYEEYESILEKQGGVCAVCKRDNEQFDKVKDDVRRLHVDHDHATGKVRGILCSKCNFALGCVRDDKEILNKLIKYLEKNNVKS